MTRSVPLLAALWLLACSPVEPGDGADASASAPVESAKSTARAQATGKRGEHPARPGAKASAQSESGGAYQYVDESGRVQFAVRLEDVPERQRSTAAHFGGTLHLRRAAAAPTHDLKEATPDHRAGHRLQHPHLRLCRAAMAYMDKIGQDYENRDVEADEDARSEYLDLTGGERGVPVIVVGRDWMQGWSQSQFDKLIAKAQ